MKPIVRVPNEVLVTEASRVTAFDRSLLRLVAEMKQTLLAADNPKGVGLAATQVGVGVKVFITKPTAKAAIRVFINPEILERSDAVTDGVPERDNKLEGCLSIPNLWGNVHRASTITLRYQDEKGAIHREKFTGFMATIIQHETDHINGILFTRRVLEQKEKLYQVAHDEDGKEVLEEISLK